MDVAIAGGTGFLGRKLARQLTAEGHRVITLTRRPTKEAGFISWTPDGSPGGLPAQLEGVHAVVNLAGEGLPDKRWTAARKEALRTSRILATRTLVRAVAACARPPKVFISASATGYYGAHGDESLTEATPPGTDFLARLCVEWEQEARPVASAVTRLAIVRTGFVLAADGGALGKMLLPFKLGAGGPFGSGDQYMSWIHADDWTALVAWLIARDQAAGPFNGTAPEPVTNREFARALGRALHRPAVLPAPAFALRLALGEMADMVLTGQRVLPAHAEQLAFRFAYHRLDDALESLKL